MTASVILAIAATYYFAQLEVKERTVNPPIPFWVPFYESWTASFAFWAIVGIIGTIITLARPEDETYSERIRILFGGINRPALKYLERQIRSLGYFATDAVTIYKITDWDANNQAYKIELILKTTVQNLLHDEDAVDDVGTEVFPDDLPSRPPSGLGAITSVKVDGGINELSSPVAVVTPNTKFPRPARIPPGKSIAVEIQRWGWFKVSETHSWAPRRFTDKVTPIFTYAGGSGPSKVNLDFAWLAGGVEPVVSTGARNCVRRELIWGKDETLPSVENIEPGKTGFAFRLSPPI